MKRGQKSGWKKMSLGPGPSNSPFTAPEPAKPPEFELECQRVGLTDTPQTYSFTKQTGTARARYSGIASEEKPGETGTQPGNPYTKIVKNRY